MIAVTRVCALAVVVISGSAFRALAAPAASSNEYPAAQYAVAPEFHLLRFGEVKPTGWILEQMRRDLAEGFAGHMPEIAPRTCGRDIFTTGRNTPRKKSDAGGQSYNSTWWNGETEGNWRSGNAMMTLLAGTPEQRAALDARIAELLKHQDADGYLGIYAPELRLQSAKGCGDLWAQTCLLRGLIAYYEATERQDVLDAVQRAAQLTVRSYQDKPLPISQHSQMFVDVAERLYDLTGNPLYRDFGLRLCREMSQRNYGAEVDMLFTRLLDPKLLHCGHGATTCESFRLLPWAACITGEPVWGKARDLAFAKAFRQVSPTGGPVGQETLEGREFQPDLTAYECCAIKEWMTSCLSAAQMTGSSTFADRAEDSYFNAAQGARLANGKAVSYCTYDNAYSRQGGVHSPVNPHWKRGDRCKLSPCHEDVANCCAPNFTQIGPVFVRSMWMRTGDGLAAVLYGPCQAVTTVNGTTVSIAEETAYPLDDTVVLNVSPENPQSFALRLRVPGWCDHAEAVCEGATISRTDGWLVLSKTWRKGDRATVTFRQKTEPVAANNREYYVRRGPLFYVYPIPAVMKPIKDYPVTGFHDYHVTPAAGAKWNLALRSASELGFAAADNPKADARYPWDTASLKLRGTLIDLDGNGPRAVELVPIGCGDAVLRRSTFPEKAVAPPAKPEAKASSR